MKRMFVLAGTLAVLSASVVGASVWTGRQAEDRIEQLVASGNQAGQIYAVHLQSYRRGWFSSDAVTDVEIKRAWLQSLSPDRPVAHSVHIVFAEHVRHGPLLFGPHRVQVGAAHIGTRLVRISGPMGSLPVDRFHYRADSLLAFDGTLHSRLTVDPVDVALHGGARLHWDGLYARMTTSPDRHIVATMHAGPVQIRGPKGYFTLAGMDFTADLRQDLPGVYYGSEAISFHGLEGGANGAPRAAVQHVVIKGISALEPGHELRSRADFDISGIEIPQIDVQEVHLGVDVDRLPEQPFLSVRKRMMAINGQNLTLQHRARAMLHLWTNVLPALLADSPTVTLRDVHVVTRAGVVKADATVHYDASVKPVPGGPPFNIQALAVQAHLRIPVVLLHRLVFTGMCRALQAAHAHNPEPDAAQLSAAAEAAAHRKIGSLINEHMLVRDGDLYHANLSVEHGKVLINGYPAPVHAPAPAG
ncbi:MAG TPA: DUF945 family protein [Gammaproteobacteria bacterium]|nr:DUF945 family protein [Gammaproteobacteria bacterium]